MEAEAGELRRQLHRSRPTRNSEGYPPKLRARVGLWLAAHRDRGRSWTELGQSLGISAATARSWGEAARGAGFVEVHAAPAVAAPAAGETEVLTLVTPQGYRVEGLRLETLVALLEQLG